MLTARNPVITVPYYNAFVLTDFISQTINNLF